MAKQAPECRVCSHRHWNRDPHVLIGGPEPSKAVRELAAVATSNGRASRAQVAMVRDVAVPLEVAFDGVGPLTRESARVLTERLKVEFEVLGAEVESLGRALELAQRRQAWKVLGYDSWNAYVEAEFEMTRQHANRLVSHQRFVLALAPRLATSEVDTTGTSGSTLTEGETRAVRSDPAKAARVRRAVAQGVAPAEAIKRATRRTKDSTGAPCEHPRTVTVVVCADCGKRVE